MKKTISCIMICLLSGAALAQKKVLNIPLLHQLVAESKDENKVQKDAKTKQGTDAGLEATNGEMTKEFKTKYQTLTERFKKLSMVLDALAVGSQCIPLSEEIFDQQSKMVSLAYKNPFLLPMALKSEGEFIERTNSLIRYVVGLSAVVGVVGQMKVSDRRILMGFIIDEMRALANTAFRIRWAMETMVSRIKMRGDLFEEYYRREKAILDGIIEKTKGIGK